MGKGKTRLYSHNKLIAWINKKCERCGKFIKKYQRKWCDKCKIKNKSNYNLEWKHRTGLYKKYYTHTNIPRNNKYSTNYSRLWRKRNVK